jgi:rhamnogalacturonyl hydrolase YesR
MRRTSAGEFSLTRRQAFASAALWPVQARDPIQNRLPGALPAGVAAILARILGQPPSALNTDWFGTMPLLGALLWRQRGITEAGEFAEAWLTHHLAAKDVAKYQGARSRVVWAGRLPITTYAGHFGISQVCELMAAELKDERARRIACDVAEIVLHRTARNHLGLVGHDDTADFAIPDVTYFAVAALMIAARLDPAGAAAWRDQALYQLRTAIDTFLIKETGLAKTLYRNGSTGKTYWTRASGWLLWSITAMLRRLPPNHPAFGGFTEDLRRLVDGMIRVQEPDGGFHVLLDEPSTPLDATGPAMFAWGVHESVRRGWLPPEYRPAAERAWRFVTANLTEDGVLRKTYYLWALPAENRDMRLRDETTGWAMGFVLGAASEMTL